MSVKSENGKKCVEENFFTYKWMIRNIDINEDNKIYQSPCFFTNDGDLKWKLDFYTATKDCNTTMVLTFDGIPLNLPFVQTYFEAWVLDSNRQKQHFQNFQIAFEYDALSDGNAYPFKFFPRSAFGDLLQDNSDLEIEFQIQTTPNLGGFLKCQNQMVVELLPFWKSNRFSDVQIQVNAKDVETSDAKYIFHAHKVILAARSGFFSSVFASDTKEIIDPLQKSVVDLGDWSWEIVGDMLNFMYTGTVVRLVYKATSLLETSYKFKIKTLNDICQDTLASVLNRDSVITVLTLADKYVMEDSENKLKIKCLNFIKENRKVTETSSFKALLTTYPHLVQEIIHHI